MKNLFLVAGLCISTFAAAQCKVYSGASGYKVAARVENGRVYLGASGYQVAARFENGRIYSGASGYTVIARVEGDKIYSGNSGYDVIGRISGDKVYQGAKRLHGGRPERWVRRHEPRGGGSGMLPVNQLAASPRNNGSVGQRLRRSKCEG